MGAVCVALSALVVDYGRQSAFASFIVVLGKGQRAGVDAGHELGEPWRGRPDWSAMSTPRVTQAAVLHVGQHVVERLRGAAVKERRSANTLSSDGMLMPSTPLAPSVLSWPATAPPLSSLASAASKLPALHRKRLSCAAVTSVASGGGAKSSVLAVQLAPPWQPWQLAAANKAAAGRPRRASVALLGVHRCADAEGDVGGDGVEVGVASGRGGGFGLPRGVGAGSIRSRSAG